MHISDVGAYQGDFARDCLQVWPDSRITCFEPQPHMKSAIDRLSAEFPGQIIHHDCLLGRHEQGSVTLYLAETASSVLTEHVTPHPGIQRPMRTIDSFNDKSPFGPCDFLKMDVQGYELEVLKGANKMLEDVQVVLAEVNLLDIHSNVPLLPEFVSWLAKRGFVPYDICGMTRRPLDGALWQIDMVFVPEDSLLREDKRWNVDV